MIEKWNERQNEPSCTDSRENIDATNSDEVTWRTMEYDNSLLTKMADCNDAIYNLCLRYSWKIEFDFGD